MKQQSHNLLISHIFIVVKRRLEDFFMSFYSGNRQGNFPGPIMGNPLNGLCEKAVIQTRKVFDACMKQIQLNGATITVDGFDPADPVFPLTFIGCQSLPDGITTSNVVVDRFDDRPCFARVTADVNIPIQVSYTDANGVAGTAQGTVTINNDVVLYVPQPSIIPYRIEAFGSAVCSDGSFNDEGVLTTNLCVTIILKVVVDADILVPTYGYAQIPPCQEFSADTCTAFFDLPLFPAQQNVCPNSNQNN